MESRTPKLFYLGGGVITVLPQPPPPTLDVPGWNKQVLCCHKLKILFYWEKRNIEPFKCVQIFGVILLTIIKHTLLLSVLHAPQFWFKGGVKILNAHPHDRALCTPPIKSKGKSCNVDFCLNGRMDGHRDRI